MNGMITTLFFFVIVLLSIAGVSFFLVMSTMSRKQKFEIRMIGATSEAQKTDNSTEEQISLAKVISRTELAKDKAANLIGVDLQQTDAYPIKWWLVPPLSLGISWVIAWLASNSIGYTTVFYFLGWPFFWFIVTKAIFISFNNKRNSKLLAQFPDALGTIVRCVRVGIPIGEALRTVARDAPEPTKLEFDILADKVQIGIPIDIALSELSQRIKVTEYQFFATAITLQMRSGGAITHTLETLADVIRKRVGLKARGYALTSEARTSSMILALLPLLTGIALFFMNRSYILLLFFTKSGHACLGAAILMLGIGLGIIQFMISNVLK